MSGAGREHRQVLSSVDADHDISVRSKALGHRHRETDPTDVAARHDNRAPGISLSWPVNRKRQSLAALAPLAMLDGFASANRRRHRDRSQSDHQTGAERPKPRGS